MCSHGEVRQKTGPSQVTQFEPADEVRRSDAMVTLCAHLLIADMVLGIDIAWSMNRRAYTIEKRRST